MKKNKIAVNSTAELTGRDQQVESVSAVLARIEYIRPSLGSMGQRIAQFIARHPQEVVHMSVSELPGARNRAKEA
jgi:hypothetical protein